MVDFSFSQSLFPSSFGALAGQTLVPFSFLSFRGAACEIKRNGWHMVGDPQQRFLGE